MTLTRIERWDVRRDGPLTEASLQRKIEALGFDVTSRTYPAGVALTTTTDSRYGIEAVVRGLVKLTIDGDPMILTAGDIVFVPRGAVRRVEVVGTTTALCLEAFKGLEPPSADAPADHDPKRLDDE
jgi:mannose-6-phosphate isomerase-like protein (cupin superfamily)